jgi:enoyl-[acyl-carrier-protein] reductase (NADH)
MDVGFACADLATSLARRITGGTVYVDGGANIVAWHETSMAGSEQIRLT